MSAVPGANGPQQAALLIDADNFSDPQAIEAAWAELKAYAGRVSVCRAYGAGPRLEFLGSVWRYLGTRTFPNLPLVKNTTDAALIADAVALHFQQGVRIFAIASGDADFAPLAVRLREWGCEVWCFSMEGIVFRDAEAYYDRVKCFPAPVFVPAPAAPVSVKPAVPVVPLRPAAAPVPVPVPAPVVPAIPVRPLQPLAAFTTAQAMAAPSVESFSSEPLSAPASSWRLSVPEEVQRILKAVPGLRETSQPLAKVVPVLREQAIFEKNTKCSVFFARYTAYFKLSPAQQPMQLAYLAPTPKAAWQAVKPLPHQASPCATALKSGAAVLSWPVALRRQATPSLLAELHGLRTVLLQLAACRVSTADVLLAAPEMLQGQPCALSAVAGRLREKGLLRPYQSALRVLERHPNAFAVEMNCHPQAVIYLR